MKGEYVPEPTSFKALLNDLEEHDPDTWKQWEDKRSKDLRKDHPDSKKILRENLDKAITKRGWKYEIKENTGNEWAAIITASEVSYLSISASKIEALLCAYIDAVKK
jgi:hypothetical protein